MRMRRASISCAFGFFAVGLVLSGGAGGAGGHSTKPPCPPAGAHVLARDEQVRVYRRGISVAACLIGRRTQMTLIGAPAPQPRQPPLRESLGTAVLAGPIVAYVVDQLTGVDTATSDLVVDDVATRKTLREAPAGHSVDAGFVFEESLTSLVATAQGSVAWIEQRGHGGHEEAASVYAAPPTGGAILLDADPAIDPESLALSHGTLSWSEGGVRKTTEMP